MNNQTLLKGMIIGMEDMGCVFIKSDQKHVFFEIKKDSDIDNKEKLSRSNHAFVDKFGLSLKIRRI